MGAQAPVFCAGAAGCALVIVAALRSAEDRFTELFHIYYQPLLVLLAMLWLWGANVRFFEGRRVRYGVCFSPHDQAFLLSGRQIHQARPQPLASAENQSDTTLRRCAVDCVVYVCSCMSSLPAAWPCLALGDSKMHSLIRLVAFWSVNSSPYVLPSCMTHWTTYTLQHKYMLQNPEQTSSCAGARRRRC